MAKWALVSDFDGTVSLVDVGDAIVTTFGGPAGWEEVDAAIHRGEINRKEAYERVYRQIEVSTEVLSKFVLGFALDPDFRAAAELFRQRGLPVLIVSDGFDFYIDRLLHRENLGWIPRYANHLEVVGNKPVYAFPYFGRLGCHDCANCKTYHLRHLKAQGYKIAYLGDGHTDCCAALGADLVFAKRYLASFLAKNCVPHHKFQRYGEVLPHLAACVRESEPEPAVLELAAEQ